MQMGRGMFHTVHLPARTFLPQIMEQLLFQRGIFRVLPGNQRQFMGHGTKQITQECIIVPQSGSTAIQRQLYAVYLPHGFHQERKIAFPTELHVTQQRKTVQIAERIPASVTADRVDLNFAGYNKLQAAAGIADII